MDIKVIRDKLRDFTEKRDWDRFHSPKNLAIATAVEASELLEIFQWLTEEESFKITEKDLKHVKEEIADIIIYLIRLSDKLNIDIEKAVIEKIEVNENKYPVSLSKGNATKYNRR